MANAVAVRLGRWKQKLIDQTLRNPLLNFRPTKVTTISVVDEKPTEVFRILHVNGKPMTFKPSAAKSAHTTSQAKEFERQDRSELQSKHLDTELQTELQLETLNTNLLKIYRKSTELFEEQGFSSLCLSLGVIEWCDSNDSEIILKAPLILVPVQLLREGAGTKFTLKATQDDPVLNPAIFEKLKSNFHLLLPQLPESFEEFDPLEYFSSIQDCISEQKRWRITEEIYLGFFAFQKFVMYKDLENAEEIYAAHSVIKSLCMVQGDEFAKAAELESERQQLCLDDIFPPEATFQVLDADSSQQEAILAAKEGKNLVIEGPPGTGKSQTIANLIAEVLAEGKTVLFVSEKMAALDVVHNRLETAGLTDFCLELHSNKTSKKSIYEEFQRVLDSPRSGDHTDDDSLDRLRILRAHLNEYSQSLHKPYGDLGFTPFRAVGEICSVGSMATVNAPLPVSVDTKADELRGICRNLSHHAKIVSGMGNPSEHAWFNSELLNVTSADEDKLNEHLSEANLLLEKLQLKCKSFSAEIGAVNPSNFGKAEILCEAASSLANSPGASESLLMNAKWNSISSDIAEILEKGQAYADQISIVSAKFQPEFLDEDFAANIKLLRDLDSKWFKFVLPDYWRLKSYFRRYFACSYKPINNEQLFSALEQAKQCRDSREFIRNKNIEGKELFDQRWKAEDSNWEELKRFAEWIVGVRKFIVEESINSQWISLAADKSAKTSEITASIKEVRALLDLARKHLDEIIRAGQFESMRELVLDPRSEFQTVQPWVTNLLSKLSLLREFVEYNQSRKACARGISETFFLKFEEQNHLVETLEPSFKRWFFRRWLDEASKERPILQKFQLSRHETFIKEFRELDTKALQLAKQRLRFKLFKQRDAQLNSKELEGELRILQRQLRMRSKLPLRKLFKQVPTLIKAIKPCFMMSPMSAAQFVDSTNPPFDIVIFDEASQITTEDSVGAIVRGTQLIVVGDTKQLPPTNFFSAQVVEEPPESKENEREELQIADLESVLDECIAGAFPVRRLKWHYRSRHESLIAFSNRKFYDSELLTFPGPETGVEERGLQFKYVGGIYDGGGINPQEARAVADAVVEHIRTTPHLSLGVGTFNIKQQTLIKDEIDMRRREDPSLEFFFSKKGEDEFFVKNLENIQGDDRDVIFLSVTYGKGSDGTLRHNFGPINGQNGWRRLNVILTRAKLRLTVFASMKSEDIDPTKTTSEGAKHLRDFLHFAEHEVLNVPEVSNKALIESPFEQSVFDELSKRGVRLVPQIGQAGYRIDFGVLDPDHPGRFLIGIECDGAMYHSAATARDRDRLRQNVLSGLGWSLIRIWSTDWFYNKENQIKRILDFIQTTKSNLIEEQTKAKEPVSAITRITIDPFPAEQAEKATTTLTDAVSNPEPIRRTRELTTYKLCPVQILGDTQHFKVSLDETIISVIIKVLEFESPIHVEELRKRVAAHWQINRVGNLIAAKINACIFSMRQKGHLNLVDDIVWKPGAQEIRARKRDTEAYSVNCELIPAAEMDDFISYVLEDGKARNREELALEVARAIGFSRSGQKLGDIIQDRVAVLLDTGRIEHCSTGIRLAQAAKELVKKK